MDIDQLKQFCLIIQTGTMISASKLLKLSPGAVSRSMQRLSDEVGFSLFRADGRRIVPTENAQKLFLVATETLHNLHSGITRIKQGVSIPKTIRIASFEVFTTYLLQELLLAEFKDETVLTLERTPGELEQAVLAGDADYGITYAPIPREELSCLKITSIQHAVFHRAGSFAGHEFSELPFAVPTTPLSTNVAEIDALDGWPRHAPARLVKYRFEMLESAILAAQDGKCCIVIPQFIASLANKRAKPIYALVQQAFPPKVGSIKFDVYLVMRKETAEDQVVKRLAKGLRRVCALKN